MQRILIFTFAALLACWPNHASAQRSKDADALQPQPVEAPATSSVRTIDPADLAAYVDGVVALWQAQKDAADAPEPCGKQG